MPAIRHAVTLLSILALASCANEPARHGAAAAPEPSAQPSQALDAPAAPAGASRRPEAHPVAAAPAPASGPAAADPRIARAAALARRPLGDPTPQQIAVREGRPAPSFARETYLDDPAAYLDTLDGLRAVSPAQPAAGVPTISAVDGTGYRVSSGGTATLRVSAQPGFPVSFATTGLGRFASGFDAITVAADAAGIAEAVFIASRDTNAQVPIHVASPVCSGVLNLLVQVE
jgi:hypothetical protein